MLVWIAKHPQAHPEMLGLIPGFIYESDPRPAREQFQERYVPGGWVPFKDFKLTERGLEYPGDPPMRLLFETRLRDETIRLYEAEWVVIIQPDGSFEASRMD